MKYIQAKAEILELIKGTKYFIIKTRVIIPTNSNREFIEKSCYEDGTIRRFIEFKFHKNSPELIKILTTTNLIKSTTQELKKEGIKKLPHICSFNPCPVFRIWIRVASINRNNVIGEEIIYALKLKNLLPAEELET